MMPPFGWRGGFLTWLSSSILRLRLSISMFCWLFLSCSSEMVCFCWLPCSCSSCRDERSEWCLSSSDDTCSCCSEKAKVGVKDDYQYITLNIESAHYTQWGGEGERVQCAGRTLIKNNSERSLSVNAPPPAVFEFSLSAVLALPWLARSHTSL